MSRGAGRSMAAVSDGMTLRASSGRMAAIVLAAALAATGMAAAAECRPDIVDIRSDGTVVRFAVELADTPETRARGLMHREELARFAGMLFIYEEPQLATFWMENTPIPLDMLFFDEAGILQRIHAEAEPFSREVIVGGEDILFVLEINGGMAYELGLKPGAELRHPAVDPDRAAWPCPEPDAR
jgi:uncharacterized membrane protein (UPF0127 family)